MRCSGVIASRATRALGRVGRPGRAPEPAGRRALPRGGPMRGVLRTPAAGPASAGWRPDFQSAQPYSPGPGVLPRLVAKVSGSVSNLLSKTARGALCGACAIVQLPSYAAPNGLSETAVLG